MTQPPPEMSVSQYDEGWDTKWDDMKKYGPMSRHQRRLIKQLARQVTFKSVLDVGCGQGSLLLELMAEHPHIEPHGVDISPSAIDFARRKVPRGTFGLLDLVHEAHPRTYDLVICSEVLEHIAEDVAAMKNLEKMTGGHLIVTTVQGRMRSFEAGEVGHVRNYGRGELVEKLQLAGFDIVKHIDWGFPFYSPLYRNYLEMTGSKGTTGEFGTGRKLLATAVYYLFHLNLPVWGDEIVVLARPRRLRAA
jgi:SAM-dependent methyltransferase